MRALSCSFLLILQMWFVNVYAQNEVSSAYYVCELKLYNGKTLNQFKGKMQDCFQVTWSHQQGMNVRDINSDWCSPTLLSDCVKDTKLTSVNGRYRLTKTIASDWYRVIVDCKIVIDDDESLINYMESWKCRNDLEENKFNYILKFSSYLYQTDKATAALHNIIHKMLILAAVAVHSFHFLIKDV